jgi:Flp pilus assembly protein TadG
MFKRLGGDRQGVAAVEFALASSVLLLMLVGAIDLGLAVRHGTQIEAAIRAGLQRALIDGTKLQPFATYENTVEAIVTNAPGLPTGATVNAILECRCVTIASGAVTEDFAVNAGTRDEGVTTGNCASSFCTAPAVMYHFVEITLAQTHNMLLGWPGIPDPIDMSMIKDVKIPTNE